MTPSGSPIFKTGKWRSEIQPIPVHLETRLDPFFTITEIATPCSSKPGGSPVPGFWGKTRPYIIYSISNSAWVAADSHCSVIASKTGGVNPAPTY